MDLNKAYKVHKAILQGQENSFVFVFEGIDKVYRGFDKVSLDPNAFKNLSPRGCDR